MAHPDDVARRMLISEKFPHSPEGRLVATRYGLFGHDLEKGVVVRGRVRGLWLPDPPSQLTRTSAAEFRRFLDQPLPLGM
jgi:hypothetical protein